MTVIKSKTDRRFDRHRKIRMKVIGTFVRPRLTVFRSSKHIYAQLIDDGAGRTLVAASDREIQKLAKTEELKKMLPKVAAAYQVGQLVATRALNHRFQGVVFDRGGYLFAGQVKALAEGARAGGLLF